MFTCQEVSANIKNHAIRLGFDACGISKAERLEQDAFHLKQWLENGDHGEMTLLQKFTRV